jgi:predicted Zn-dependent protease
MEDATLIARYYYIKRKIKKSYDSLFEANTKEKYNEKNKRYFIKYYQLKSDLGWYLQDNKNAVKASEMLMKHKQARLVDYERIIFYYQDKDPSFSAYAAKKAYKEYKLSYLFYTYANDALFNQNYKELKSIIDDIDEKTSPLVNDAMYWVIKSKVYKHFNQLTTAKEYLLKALSLNPDDYQIKLTLLWFYIDLNDEEMLKTMLTDLAENPNINPSFYFPMASAYFYLQDINRASYYTQLLISLNDPMINLIQFKFLQAYIYQIQNNQEAFKSHMIEIIKILKQKLQVLLVALFYYHYHFFQELNKKAYQQLKALH